MIGDEYEYNEYANSPRLSTEGLNSAWHIFREDDVLLIYDDSNGVWHA